MTIAHRAGNSLQTLREAEAAGADLLEVDVHLFRGRLEARHLKTVGPLPLYWDRWELRGPATAVLGLDTVVAETSRPLLVDLKGGDRRLAGAVAEMFSGRAGDTWVCSRRWRHLEPLAGRPGLRVLASVGSRAQLARLLRRYGPGDLDGISINRELLTSAAVVEDLRVRAEVVMTWRVNDLDAATQLYGLGVSGFISDRYDLLANLSAIGAAAG